MATEKINFVGRPNLCSTLTATRSRACMEKTIRAKKRTMWQNAVAYGFDNYYALMIGHAIGSAYDLKKLGVSRARKRSTTMSTRRATKSSLMLFPAI